MPMIQTLEGLDFGELGVSDGAEDFQRSTDGSIPNQGSALINDFLKNPKGTLETFALSSEGLVDSVGELLLIAIKVGRATDVVTALPKDVLKRIAALPGTGMFGPVVAVAKGELKRRRNKLIGLALAGGAIALVLYGAVKERS